MERLTESRGDGTSYLKVCERCDVPVSFDCGDCDAFEKAIDRLSQLEDNYEKDIEKTMLKIDEGKIINHYGFRPQLEKTIEEYQELVEAIEGYISGDDTAEHLMEEIADVEVMVDQLKLYIGCWEEVDRIKRFKVNRQLKRIEGEKAGHDERLDREQEQRL